MAHAGPPPSHAAHTSGTVLISSFVCRSRERPPPPALPAGAAAGATHADAAHTPPRREVLELEPRAIAHEIELERERRAGVAPKPSLAMTDALLLDWRQPVSRPLRPHHLHATEVRGRLVVGKVVAARQRRRVGVGELERQRQVRRRGVVRWAALQRSVSGTEMRRVENSLRFGCIESPPWSMGTVALRLPSPRSKARAPLRW